MEAAYARLGLHLSKCHIVGNHMSRLKCNKHSLPVCVSVYPCGDDYIAHTRISVYFLLVLFAVFT